MSAEKIRLESGKTYTPKPSDEVKCLVHNFVTTYEKLGPYALLSFYAGLDSTEDSPCLLDRKSVV